MENECKQCTSTINNDAYLPNDCFIVDKKGILWGYIYQRWSAYKMKLKFLNLFIYSFFFLVSLLRAVFIIFTSSFHKCIFWNMMSYSKFFIYLFFDMPFYSYSDRKPSPQFYLFYRPVFTYIHLNIEKVLL